MYWNGQTDSLKGSMMSKLPIISKKALNKSLENYSVDAYVYLPQEWS